MVLSYAELEKGMDVGNGVFYNSVGDRIDIAEFIKLLYTQPTEYWFEMNEGNIELHIPISISAENPDLAKSPSNSTIWSEQARYVFPSSPSGLTVYSLSDEDKPTGLGCPEITIRGLDGNYEAFEERIELNGTTPVTTIATDFFRVNEAICEIRACLGTIYIDSGADTVAVISPQCNITRQGIFTVPYVSGFETNLYIVHHKVSAVKGNEGRTCVFVTNPENFIPVNQFSYYFFQNSPKIIERIYPKVPEKHDLELVASSSGSVGDASLSAWMETVLVLTPI